MLYVYMIILNLAEAFESGPSATGITPDSDLVTHELNTGALLDAADLNSTGQVMEAIRAIGSDIDTTASTSAASGDKSYYIISSSETGVEFYSVLNNFFTGFKAPIDSQF
jgi:hypothetical protein